MQPATNVIKLLAALLFLLLPGLAWAADAQPAAADPALEKRLTTLASELRCLVCQNQSLADSHADLAVDLRNEVREQMKAGKSDAEIRDWLTARYGDFVLYRPPLKPRTLLLWLGPFLLLAAAVAGLVFYLRRRERQLVQQPLNDEQQARVQALLRGEQAGPGPDTP
jgi:cytochrome c-type biogenesis protein CcmH